MRLFTQKVFEDVVYIGTGTYYSDPTYNALLGSAETLVVEGYGDTATATPTVSISSEHSNDNKNWDSLTANFVSGIAPTTTASKTILGTDSGKCGAYRRLKIVISGAGSSCRLVVIACGRGEQGGA